MIGSPSAFADPCHRVRRAGVAAEVGQQDDELVAAEPRHQVALAHAALAAVRATSRSAASPAALLCESLIFLKSLRSSISSGVRARPRAEARQAKLASVRSSARRFARPVSGSVSASRRVRRSASTRSVTSS